MRGRAYRLLIRLYPSELRESHEQEMVELAEHYRARGFGWLLVFDLMTSVPIAHLRAARARREARARSEVMRSMGKELVFAFRNMRRSPSVTFFAILTLALGIGASTAIFSVVNAVALRPLPYPEPDRVVAVWSTQRNAPGRRGSLSQPDLRDLQSELRTLEALVGYSSSGLTLTGMGPPEVVRGTLVSDGLLKAFGLKPVAGRDLDGSENVPGGPRVAVIGYGFWQERFGGTDALGRTVTLDGEPYEVVGIAPPGFDFPDAAQVFRPMYLDTEGCGRGCHVLRAVGLLSQGSSLIEVGRELSVLGSRLESEHAITNTGKGFEPLSLEDYIVGGEIRTALFVLLAAVGVVLLIGCANVAHLLLARASERAGEMAVRSALGASGSRLIRQLLLEALALAIVSTLAGALFAAWALQFLLGLAPSSLPRVSQVSLDGPVLLFALVMTLFVTLAFGLVPALDLSRSSLAGAIGQGARTVRKRARFREVLLAAQVALCLSLLFAAGLLLRSFAELRGTSLGFVKEDVLTFDVNLPAAKYPGADDWVRVFETIENDLRQIPGVEAVGSVFGSPMGVQSITTEIVPLDRPAALPGEELHARLRVVTPGYLGTLGVPLLRGRGIEPTDRRDRQPIALVNESFVRAFYPDKDALGEQVEQTVSFSYSEEEPRTIVGVVGDFLSRSVTESATPEVYVPQAQMGSDFLTMMIRAPGASETLLGPVKKVIETVDPDLPLRRLELLETAVDRSIGPTRFYFLLLAVFAALAVALAATGLYGVVVYLVSRRTREIGIRMALGARSREVLQMVFVEAMRPALLGVAIGLVVVYLESKALAALLYNVAPLDPMVLGAVVALLLAVAMAAVVAPARRAARISPATTLRREG